MSKPSTASEMGKRAAEAIAEGFAIDGAYAADIAQIIDREYAPFVSAVRAAVEAGAVDEIHLSLIRAELTKLGGTQ